MLLRACLILAAPCTAAADDGGEHLEPGALLNPLVGDSHTMQYRQTVEASFQRQNAKAEFPEVIFWVACPTVIVPST